MKKYRFVPLATIVISGLLSGCNGPDGEILPTLKKPPHAPYVETDEMNVGSTDAEDQELADGVWDYM